MDQAVNRTIPFYNRLEDLHANAREIPQIPEWPRMASLINELMFDAVGTDKSVVTLLEYAQAKAAKVVISR